MDEKKHEQHTAPSSKCLMSCLNSAIEVDFDMVVSTSSSLDTNVVTFPTTTYSDESFSFLGNNIPPLRDTVGFNKSFDNGTSTGSFGRTSTEIKYWYKIHELFDGCGPSSTELKTSNIKPSMKKKMVHRLLSEIKEIQRDEEFTNYFRCRDKKVRDSAIAAISCYLIYGRNGTIPVDIWFMSLETMVKTGLYDSTLLCLDTILFIRDIRSSMHEELPQCSSVLEGSVHRLRKDVIPDIFEMCRNYGVSHEDLDRFVPTFGSIAKCFHTYYANRSALVETWSMVIRKIIQKRAVLGTIQSKMFTENWCVDIKLLDRSLNIQNHVACMESMITTSFSKECALNTTRRRGSERSWFDLNVFNLRFTDNVINFPKHLPIWSNSAITIKQDPVTCLPEVSVNWSVLPNLVQLQRSDNVIAEIIALKKHIQWFKKTIKDQPNISNTKGLVNQIRGEQLAINVWVNLCKFVKHISQTISPNQIPGRETKSRCVSANQFGKVSVSCQLIEKTYICEKALCDVENYYREISKSETKLDDDISTSRKKQPTTKETDKQHFSDDDSSFQNECSNSYYSSSSDGGSSSSKSVCDEDLDDMVALDLVPNHTRSANHSNGEEDECDSVVNWDELTNDASSEESTSVSGDDIVCSDEDIDDYHRKNLNPTPKPKYIARSGRISHVVIDLENEEKKWKSLKQPKMPKYSTPKLQKKKCPKEPIKFPEIRVSTKQKMALPISSDKILENNKSLKRKAASIMAIDVTDSQNGDGDVQPKRRKMKKDKTSIDAGELAKP